MAQSDFVILDKFGGDLKIQLRIGNDPFLTRNITQ